MRQNAGMDGRSMLPPDWIKRSLRVSFVFLGVRIYIDASSRVPPSAHKSAKTCGYTHHCVRQYLHATNTPVHCIRAFQTQVARLVYIRESYFIIMSSRPASGLIKIETSVDMLYLDQIEQNLFG